MDLTLGQIRQAMENARTLADNSRLSYVKAKRTYMNALRPTIINEIVGQLREAGIRHQMWALDDYSSGYMITLIVESSTYISGVYAAISSPYIDDEAKIDIPIQVEARTRPDLMEKASLIYDPSK